MRSASIPGSSRARPVAIVGAALIGALVAATIWYAVRDRETVVADWERLSASLVTVTTEHVARTFEAIDRTLQAAEDAYRRFSDHQISSGDDDARLRAYEILRSIVHGSAALAGISWSDAEGNRVAQSTSPERVSLNVSTQRQFSVHRDSADVGLFISHPFRSAINNEWIVVVSRRINGPDGRFLGVVQGALNLGYLIGTYNSVELGHDGLMSLLFEDGTILLRGHDTLSQLGGSLADTEAFRSAISGYQYGTFRALLPVSRAPSGERRIVSFRRVPGNPLIALFGFSEADVLAEWRQRTIAILTTVAAVVVVMVLCLAGLVRQLSRGHRQQIHLNDLAERLTQSYDAVSTANMRMREEIAAKARVEESLRIAGAEADRANRAKSDFLAMMSHEIRTPMTGIVGYADLIVEAKPAPPVSDHALIVRDSARALLGVINDVLDFSRIEAGQMTVENEVLSPHTVVQDTLALVKVIAAEKSIRISTAIAPDVPAWVHGDGIRLRQVLTNLLGNALKFTESGEITIELTRACSPQGNPTLRFAVTDTGIGIPQEKLGRLFRRFSQVDHSIGRRFGGTGLGLAISKRLVELMDGDMGVESAVGVGSTFWFTISLSIASPPEIAPAEVQGGSSLAAQRPAKVLVVDDIAVNRMLVRGLLVAAGNHVELAASGAEAIEMVASNDYDVILMDVNMPGMDGFEATARIRCMAGAKASTPVVALTASTMSDEMTRCRSAGMDGHIGKPIDRAGLLREVARFRHRSLATQGPAAAAIPEVVEFEVARLSELEGLLGRPAVADLARLWVASLSSEAPKLSAAVARGDWRQASLVAHALVGGAGNLGFGHLSRDLQAFEQVSNATANRACADQASAHSLHATLQEQLARATVILQERYPEVRAA